MLHRQKERSGFSNLLSADNLFRNLTPRALQSLTRIKRARRFPKDILLFEAGRAARDIYILRKGQARRLLYPESKNGNLTRLVEPNETLGLLETITGLPHKTSAETLSSCLFEFIRREDFIKFLSEEHEVCFRLVRLLALNIQKKTATHSPFNHLEIAGITRKCDTRHRRFTR